MPGARELTEGEWAMVLAGKPRHTAKAIGVKVRTIYNWRSGLSRPVVKPNPVVRYYGPIEVKWDPSEAKRLDEIKQAKMERGLLNDVAST